MSKRNGDTSGRTHTYVASFSGGQPAPMSVQAERFEVEAGADQATFYTGGAVTAIVRGGWLAIVQQPDPPEPESQS